MSFELLHSGIGAVIILSGLSWVYWLRQIALEASDAVREEEKLTWRTLPDALIYAIRPISRGFQLWDRHAERFPNSKKRVYAAVSLLLFLIVGVVWIMVSIFVTGQP